MQQAGAGRKQPRRPGCAGARRPTEHLFPHPANVPFFVVSTREGEISSFAEFLLAAPVEMAATAVVAEGVQAAVQFNTITILQEINEHS
jgi:hypothetical protein